VDWLQFFASLIGSLAWPAVVIAVLFLLRTHLVAIATRIEELSLPGGTAIKLAKQVRQVQTEAELVEAEQGLDEAAPVITLDPSVLQLAEQFPEAAVLEAYKELESVLLQIRARLPNGKPRRTGPEVMTDLLDQKYISESIFSLYQTLRETRNTLVHVRGDRLSQATAVELISQVKLLTDILRRVLNQLARQ
jgi:hypothetical protein